MIQERKSDFFAGNYDFDFINMSDWPIIRKIWFMARIPQNYDYKELVIGGWDSLPLLVASLISPKKKNSTIVESSYIESKISGLKGLIKKIYFSRHKTAYASGKSQAKLVNILNPKIKDIRITKGVGIFNYIPQPHFQEKKEIKNFLYVGRLSPEKNLDFLISVFNKLPNLILNIVGYGNQKDELEKIANHNIKFLGSIDNKKLSKIYQQNDVFILPSKVEPWGLVVEEALNNGLPILLSNRVGCLEELLSEGKNGFSFIYNDDASLINTINKIINPQTYNTITKCISKMNFEEIAQNQVKLYLHE